MANANKKGFQFLGLLKGIRSRQAGPKNKPTEQWTEYNVVLEDDNYETYQFRLGKRQVDANLQDKIMKLQGKEVLVPVYRQVRNTEKGRYETWYYGSEDIPQVVS